MDKTRCVQQKKESTPGRRATSKPLGKPTTHNNHMKRRSASSVVEQGEWNKLHFLLVRITFKRLAIVSVGEVWDQPRAEIPRGHVSRYTWWEHPGKNSGKVYQRQGCMDSTYMWTNNSTTGLSADTSLPVISGDTHKNLPYGTFRTLKKQKQGHSLGGEKG